MLFVRYAFFFLLVFFSFKTNSDMVLRKQTRRLKPIFGMNFNQSKFEILDILTTRRNVIIFIQDSNNNVFLVKQSKNLCNPIYFIREKLAAYIAKVNNIAAHEVEIIPASIVTPGKLYNKQSATIHKFLSGYPVTLFEKWCNLHIAQSYKTTKPVQNRGLKYKIIKSMALHNDLPRIVALDTFIGNTDRYASNLFFNDEINKFYAIDMEKSCKNNLAEISCASVKCMLDDEELYLSKEEINGLKVYKDTLQGLVNKHTPFQLYKMIDIFVLQTGLRVGSLFRARVFKKKYLELKQFILQTHASSLELLTLLDKLIKVHQY